MRRRRVGRAGLVDLLGLALAAGVAAGAGCSGSVENHLPQMLTVEAQWNDSPSAVDQIGYQLWVDFLWPDRRLSCYPLSPTLAIHINDDLVVAPQIEGDCGYESFVIVDGIEARGSISVSLQDGDQVLGEGIFEGLFPASGATLTAPAAGQPVQAGAPFTIALPLPAEPDISAARFYWTDIPSGVPPFYSGVAGTISADGSTFQGTAPTTPTGQAIVVVESIFGQGNYVAATSCTGFQFCNGLPNFDEAGPVSIDVAP